MANRTTLHVNRLESFKQWLEQQGIAYRPGKGDFQILQVLTEQHGWQCIHRRLHMPEHCTVQDKLMPLVRRFINSPENKA